MSRRIRAIALSRTVATREPSPSTGSRPYGRVSTIAKVLVGTAALYLVIFIYGSLAT